jgi:predicted dehydrogenase
MLENENLDLLIVTTVDATHDQYIIPALYKGVRILTEKPMTT